MTQAQVIAQLRGWAPLIALQIEYSLLERTVEGELIPMARELGLGVTPWSPLKSGLLSGKYTRANHGKASSDRGAMVAPFLNEKTYTVVDELLRIAKAVDTTPARVALAWLSHKPGVASPIIGARTLEQLEQNLGALEVKLAPEHMLALDKVSEPQLNFPAAFLNFLPSIMHGGLSVNGVLAPASPFTPQAGRPGPKY